jgi:hypothetical protein
MKTPKRLFNFLILITKKLIRPRFSVPISALILGIVLFNSCKKMDSESKHKPPNKYADSAMTYTHSNYQQAMNDVTIDGNGHMVFYNMSQLDAVVYALDSLGDSTAQVWEKGIGFSSIRLQCDQLANIYGAMGTDSDTVNITKQDLQNFWKRNANVAIINQNCFDINASDPGIAWVIASDHITIVGNIFI